jgi:16S rRNA C967 or C1407 C5-methylase (RsmB/RsmF family)/NOL1/NOP2/fmu family ribosome biogenesis protein
MHAILGEEYASFEQALSTASPTSIRYNPHKKSEAKPATPVPWCSNAGYLASRPQFVYDPLWHGGAYYVQEAGSMFAGYVLEQLLPQLEHPFVLDLCAAPGGKSTHLASVLYGKGFLVSNEVVRSRLNILEENLSKWGLPNIAITHNDPSHFSRLENLFDVIVVDAPCSGEGLFRKQPDAVQEWSAEQVGFCATRQQQILEDIWPSLKPGGFLIYSTCTYNRQENELNAEWMKNELGANFISIPVPQEWGITVSDSFYRFYPHKTKSEGFFLTVMQKEVEQYSNRSIFNKKNYFYRAKEESPRLKDWFDMEGMSFMKQPNGLVNILPEAFYTEIEFIAARLKVIKAGTEVAEIKGKDLNPTQGAANSILLNKSDFSVVDLGLDDALRFLSKQELDFEGELGFNLLSYQHVSLGWAKKMPQRANNYYPQEWRIRQVRS